MLNPEQRAEALQTPDQKKRGPKPLPEVERRQRRKESLQRYDKSNKGRDGRIRRYHDNIEEARRQSRERVGRFREKQKQQQQIDIFPPQT